MADDELLSNEVQDCIRSCLDTYSMCQETLNYSLQHGGKYSDANLIRLLIDCADACQANAAFMLRNSDLYMSTSSVCAEVCDACAEMCEQIPSDEQMAVCADQCRSCADLCDRISQQTLAA